MKFRTKINTNELFQFLLHHAYRGINGKIGLIISLASAVLFVIGIPDFSGNETKMVVFAIIALLYTVINPIMLYTKAKKQKLTNPVYKKEMEYVLDDEGIKLYVEDQEGGIPWDRIVMITETSSLYILYTTRVNAFLWQKKDLGTQSQEIMNYVIEHIDPSVVKLPKKMRG